MTKKDFELLANLNKAYNGALEMFGAKNVINVKTSEIFMTDLLEKAKEAGLEVKFKEREDIGMYSYEALIVVNDVKFTSYASKEELEEYNNGIVY